MADSILKSIALQRQGLETEIATLEGRVAALRVEIKKLNEAEAALRGMSVTTFKTVGVKEAAKVEPIGNASKPPTIKQMVLVVLEGHPAGLSALEILKLINERYGTDYPRTSLSPQLSRLYQAGQIHKRGKTWLMGLSPFEKIITEAGLGMD